MVLFLKIVGGLAALVLGIYLGMGRYTQTNDEIAARLGSGKPRQAKRHFIWLNFLKTDERASDRRRGQRESRFKTAVARDSESDSVTEPGGESH